MTWKNRFLILMEQALLLFPAPKTGYTPLFMTGCPRSGTTIAFQVLLAAYDVCYFDNADKTSRKHPIMNHLFAKHVVSDGAGKFQNEYGVIKGDHAPSDGWGIFHRFFPYYHHPGHVKKVKDLKKTIYWLQFIHRKPFINKNNANSLRLSELFHLFPKALFIHIERELIPTVLSIVNSMNAKAPNFDGFWSTGPGNAFVEITFDSKVERAVFQYYTIQYYVDWIEEQFSKIRLVRVPYPESIESLDILERVKELDTEGVFKAVGSSIHTSFFRKSNKSLDEAFVSAVIACEERMAIAAKETILKMTNEGVA